MLVATLFGLVFIPVTFSVVEYLSHRFARGGRGTTMDSSHDMVPRQLGRVAALEHESEGEHV